MPLHPTWFDLSIRIVLTVLAGAVIGLNRGVHGHAAGLRTTILVALAACVAMIQANILLPVGGKTTDSFGTMDLMRLPLGILTGVGFIGGGSILKRGDLVTGVTTAATLWVVTVIGLCFGGGQIGIGIGSTVLSVLTLTTMKWLDVRIPRKHRAMLTIRIRAAEQVPTAELSKLLKPMDYSLRFAGISAEGEGETARQIKYEIDWKRAEISGPPTELLEFLDRHFSVLSLQPVAEDE